MNDNQEVKIGMTDGDDSQELQPSCMRAFMVDHNSDRDDEINVKYVDSNEGWEVLHGDQWLGCVRYGLDIFGYHAYQISDGEFKGEFNATPNLSDFRKMEKPEEERLERAYELYKAWSDDNGRTPYVAESFEDFTMTFHGKPSDTASDWLRVLDKAEELLDRK